MENVPLILELFFIVRMDLVGTEEIMNIRLGFVSLNCKSPHSMFKVLQSFV